MSTTKLPIATEANGLTPTEIRRMNQIARMVNHGPNKNLKDGAKLEAWKTTPVEFIKDALTHGLDSDGNATETTREFLISAIDRFGQGRATMGSRVEHVSEMIADRFFDNDPTPKDRPERFAGLRRTARTAGRGVLIIGGLWFFLVTSSFAAFLIGFLIPSVALLIYSILSALGGIALTTAIEAPVDVALELVMTILEKLGLNLRRGEPLAKRLVNFMHDWLYIAGIFGGAGAIVVAAWLPDWSRWLTLLAALITLILTSQDIRFDFGDEVRADALRRRQALKWLSYGLLAASIVIVPITYSPERVMRIYGKAEAGVIHTPNTPIEKSSLVDVFGEEAVLENGPVRHEEDGTIYSLEELTAKIPGVAIKAEKKDGHFHYLWKPSVRAKLAEFFGLGDWYARHLSKAPPEPTASAPSFTPTVESAPAFVELPLAPSVVTRPKKTTPKQTSNRPVHEPGTRMFTDAECAINYTTPETIKHCKLQVW